jgi:hypothetical protein
MNSKPVLMIHEIEEKMFSLPLENYILTFDDGLYSQYYYWPQFQKINTEKIYFISSGCIANGEQSTNFISCKSAHQKAFAGNFEDYMSITQIKELANDPLVTIGCHGHSHFNLSEMPRLIDKINYLHKDSKKMIEWFEINFEKIPKILWVLLIFMFLTTELGPSDIYPKELRTWIVDTAQLKVFPCILFWIAIILYSSLGIRLKST